MKKIIIVLIGFILNFNISYSEEMIKIGIILGFTGSVETLTPAMADSIELAFKEISDGENYNTGKNFKLIRADSTCENLDKATDAARNLIKKNVSVLIGGACPNISKTIALNVLIPNNIIMISPVDSNFKLSKEQEKKIFFTSVPLNERKAEILSEITKSRGVKNVAIAYANNEYDKEFSLNYKNFLEEKKINVTIYKEHDEKKIDYSSYISSIAAAGGDALAIISQYEKGGKKIIKSSLDSGAFDKFIFTEDMISSDLLKNFNKNLDKSFGFLQGSLSKGFKKFEIIANENGLDLGNPFIGESYDAAALIILAIQSGESLDTKVLSKNILSVANSPGIKIYPGEINKGLKILRSGKSINYQGATEIEFSKFGETLGSFLEIGFKKGELIVKKQR